MNEIEKEIEEFKKKFTFILLDRTDKDNGKRIMKPESRGASCDEIKTFLSQALLRTEKRAREERDKEMLQKIQWCEDDRIGSSNTLYELKKFINNKHE